VARKVAEISRVFQKAGGSRELGAMFLIHDRIDRPLCGSALVRYSLAASVGGAYGTDS
jgi:hypothetical protein